MKKDVVPNRCPNEEKIMVKIESREKVWMKKEDSST